MEMQFAIQTFYRALRWMNVERWDFLDREEFVNTQHIKLNAWKMKTKKLDSPNSIWRLSRMYVAPLSHAPTNDASLTN